MNLVRASEQHLKEIERIYLYSFPESERIDFKDIVNRTFPNSELFAFIENEKLIGFSSAKKIS